MDPTMQRWDLDINNQIFIMLFPYVWNPFKNILMTFETFLMVSILRQNKKHLVKGNYCKLPRACSNCL